jgi:iron-sulfur cluster repair protein YtfE (RIC family)
MIGARAIEDGQGDFAAHEHRDLAAGLAFLGETIERSTELSSTELWAGLHRVLGWLERELKPHMAWEDAVLYPELDAIAGTPWATRLAHHEHRQIEAAIAGLHADLVGWLGHSSARTHAEVIARLAAIRAVIVSHVEREERFLLPLLEERPKAHR